MNIIRQLRVCVGYGEHRAHSERCVREMRQMITP